MEVGTWLVREVPSAAAIYAALASWLDIPIAVLDEELEGAFRTLPRA